MFARKPFSGAAEAGVNFVENQQRAEFVAQFPEQRQKFRRRNVDAAARLNRFDENRADPFAAEKLADAGFNISGTSYTSPESVLGSQSSPRLLGNGTKWPNSRKLRAGTVRGKNRGAWR